MSEPFSFLKAIDFSPAAIGKSLSIVVKAGAVILAVWWLWATLIKPHTNPVPTTTQKAQEICNNYNNPKATFGCSAVKVFMYRHPEGITNNAAANETKGNTTNH